MASLGEFFLSQQHSRCDGTRCPCSAESSLLGNILSLLHTCLILSTSKRVRWEKIKTQYTNTIAWTKMCHFQVPRLSSYVPPQKKLGRRFSILLWYFAQPLPGYNEPMRTRVHNNAGSEAVIRESFQINIDVTRWEADVPWFQWLPRNTFSNGRWLFKPTTST